MIRLSEETTVSLPLQPSPTLIGKSWTDVFSLSKISKKPQWVKTDATEN